MALKPVEKRYQSIMTGLLFGFFFTTKGGKIIRGIPSSSEIVFADPLAVINLSANPPMKIGDVNSQFLHSTSQIGDPGVEFSLT